MLILDANVVAHGLGHYYSSNRPIIKKFTSVKFKDSVFSDAYKLKDTPYSVSEDFSLAVQEVRRKLLVFAKTKDRKF